MIQTNVSETSLIAVLMQEWDREEPLSFMLIIDHMPLQWLAKHKDMNSKITI